MLKPALLAALALACATPAAQARHHGHPGAIAQIASPRLHGGRGEAVRRAAVGRSEILAHPRGCPARLFCGCGAAVRVFGAPIRSLWLATNWFRFPRTSPAPGMVAVRRHHVFVLERRLGSDIWRVYDANSGHHLTRVHARSIAGWTIVDPHG